MDLAGRDVSEYDNPSFLLFDINIPFCRYLEVLLRRAGYAFQSSSERDAVRQIKEAACYVAFNPSEEEKAHRSRRGGLAHRSVPSADKKQVLYKLPDGNTINLGAECFLAPEILFTPDIVGYEFHDGIHGCLLRSILRTDMDLRSRLFANIVLAGGSTMFRGFGDRLLSQLKASAPPDIKIKILAPQERRYSTWIGGSILGSLTTFRQMWVSKDLYNEHGADILHKKCF